MDHRLDTCCIKVLLCEIYRYNKIVSKQVNHLSYLVQHLLHQIKAQQFYIDLGHYQQCKSPTENSKTQDLFKALEWFSCTFQGSFNLEDFSRKPSILNYFFLFKPVWTPFIILIKKIWVILWETRGPSGPKSLTWVCFKACKYRYLLKADHVPGETWGRAILAPGA